ncbi:PREDICTED: cadherin-5 [Nanorana parkeri]|uniref:cadherin-5 n=1 Tax=Nanorana parkeri TaxID=125878 RepID=UPI000854954E|nr:PREDICTED: cadherin-5 [Nanorana parkeri]
MKLLWLHLLVCIFGSAPLALCTVENPWQERHHRVKRGWIWKEMATPEGQTRFPFRIGTLRSDKPNGKYVLQGEFADTYFKVDEVSGDVHGWETLDREKKSTYNLTALLVDKTTMKTLEPPETFIIRVIDINDNAPIFKQESYNVSVPEMSKHGTLVTVINAEDADDPTMSGNAIVKYTIIHGQEKFYINEDTGQIYTAVSNLDREEQANYEIIVQAKDSPGQNGGLSSTATVTIHLKDINDNFPMFTENQFTFNVSEDRRVGDVIGKLLVIDIDEPQNRNTKYSFLKQMYEEWFHIKPNQETNEGLLILKKPLNFEGDHNKFKMTVDATDYSINVGAARPDKRKSLTEVVVNVLDVDEPPEFTQPYYLFPFKENKKDIFPGTVSAKDPDKEKRSVKYSLKPERDDVIITKEGTIHIKKPFDREESAWLNLTVIAEEIGSPTNKASSAVVYLQVQDENDNAPELTYPYVPRVCENVANEHVILNISATDKDEPFPGMKFTFSSAGHENNFTVQDNRDNTASIKVKNGVFDPNEAKFYYLPIIIADNGKPPLTSTNTLTITVCKCNEKGEFTYCEEAGKLAAVSASTIVIVLVSILLILLAVILAVLFIRRMQTKSPLILGKNPAEIHEQLVTYDEEGGGEMDTNSYDVSVLNSVRRNVVMPRYEVDPGPTLYAQVQKPSRTGDMFSVIEAKKDEADNDGEELPYDTLHIFGYEGSESNVESLSSLESGSSDSEIDYDVLNEWGPRFKMLADMYGLEHLEEFAY